MPGPPDHIAELVENAYNGNSDFNSRAFTAALWFVGHDLSEDDYVDYVSTSGIGIGYQRNDLTKRLRKTYQDAEDKYDPALAGGSAPPGFAEKMAELYEAIEGSTRRDKAHALALVQHAINTGHNPVNASVRQLADISGRTLEATRKVMERWQRSAGDGLLLNVSYDGVYGHSRLWHIHTCYRPGKVDICTCKNICPPLGDPEARFREYVEPLPMGTELTVSLVAAELAITRPAARRLLDKYTDEYFGGGFFAGDRKSRLPAKWWREPTKPWFVPATA
ncbi:hypothetical protein QGN31_23355 [Mycobacterium sp. 2-64]|uniref:hypothetical protein n=1 Tax=Mycobacterium sp. 2-64 TaxID=3042319 RepID=UPI002DD98A17|nr:hypothetical protein [Mycobacterium sp. 2-64]WSE51009.1 hypothetical protein QGN31_23355 [Mycobacterium sp. 2-64]